MRKRSSDVQTHFILPDQVEEEAHIVKMDFYKATTSKLVVFGLLSLLTVGLLALLAKWKYSIRILLMYVKATPAEAEYIFIRCIDGTVEYVSIETKDLCLDGTRKPYKTFAYRLYRFYFDRSSYVYRPIQYIIKDKTYEDVHNDLGNTPDSYAVNLLNYGENSTDIPVKSNFEILFDEILSPFYIFQVFSVVLWGFFEDYVIYASFIFVISVITLTITFLKTKENFRKLQEKAYYETDIKVYTFSMEGGKKTMTQDKIISSKLLVPGDLIEVPNGKKMPCDVILLNGICIMNESMLTGESVPVIKQQLPRLDKKFDANNADQYLLYSGTECLETRKSDSNSPVLGVVLRTGFATMKGRLVRSFLYSKPENFKFYADSLKYIGAMTALAAFCFVFSLKTFIENDEEIGHIVMRSLDIITIAIPPALPTCVAIGASIASARLEKNKIITKSEQKINVAGKVQFMCFDKTGTLTKDSLDLHGVRPLARGESNDFKFLPLIKENIHSSLNYSDSKTQSHKMLELMATCHSLTYVKGSISGDPLDMKMFEAVGWHLNENAGGSGAEARLCSLNPPISGSSGYYKPVSQILVLKKFDFSPKLSRMSTIIKDPMEEKQRIYVKGSPEMIVSLSRPETVPEDFSKVLFSYTQSGLRVIACATKLLEERVNPSDELNREHYEKELEFLGFLIFENKMKEVTPSIISKLKRADINTIMLTGDNPLTAIFVARSCGIIEPNQKVLLGTLVSPKEDSSSKRIEWTHVEGIKIDERILEDPDSLRKVAPPVAIEMSERTLNDSLSIASAKTNDDLMKFELNETLDKDKDLAIAMTGDAFNYFNSSQDTTPVLRDKILRKSKVLARMRPDDKAFVVNKLQDQGYIVGMCGDGANDCPALKVANVGISLSEAEASLAAPFMSKVANIACVDILLREGRTALVTSFQCFKYMSMYSLIQTFSVVILYSKSTNMTDPCFLYQDLFIIMPAAITMSLTLPTNKLSKQQPTGTLLGATVLSSVLGQCVIQAVSQILAIVLLQGQSWYQTPTELYDAAVEETGEEEPTVYDYDAAILFMIGNVQYFAVVMAFSIGKPFREPFYTNIAFTLSVGITGIISFILILVPIPAFLDLLELKSFDGNEGFRMVILIIVILNTITTLAYEKFVVPFFGAMWKRRSQNRAKKL